MRLIGQPKRLGPCPRRHLKYVEIVVIVVCHHVQNIETLDTYLRQIVQPAVFQSHLQVSFHQPLAQMTRPEAIGGKLFTREMHEPDVTAQLTFSTQLKKYRSTQHKSSSG